ncbi:MAG: WD40 repeat domain-containing protein [Candidatus Methylumidiphilus sp.]
MLWRLLHQLPTGYAHEAVSQLLALLGENGAVELLNVCEPINPPVDAKLRRSITAAYPFLSDKQSITPFVWLLGFAVSIGFVPYDIKLELDNDTWRQFLWIAVGEKNANELREWQKLPHDKDKWRPKLNTLRIGRLLFRLPLLIGLALSLALLLNAAPQASINEIIIIIAVFTLILFSISWIVLGVWLFWRSFLKARGLLGNLDAYPADFSFWLDLYQAEEPIWRRTVGWCPIVLRRGAFFSYSIFLFSVALFLHNPSFARYPGKYGEILALATNNQGTWLLSGERNDGILREIVTGVEFRLDYNHSVEAVAFAPDGKTLLTGSRDNTAKLWNAITGIELRQMQHAASVNAVAFSPDGKTVLTGSNDTTARLWDAATGTELRRLQHDEEVNEVAFSPDGKTVLTGSFYDKTARLWDLVTGKPLLMLKHESKYGGFNAVAFSTDGKILLTGSVDGVRLWDASTGKEMPRQYDTGSVNIIAFSPDHKTMLTNSRTNSWSVVRVWDVATGTELQRLQPEEDVSAAIFSSDGNSIYTAGYEGIIRAWDTKTGRLLWQTQRPFWDTSTWKSWSILYMWLALVFIVYFLPVLKIFDRGQVWYPLGKPNRYLGLYDLPGVERWLPPK